MNRFEDAVAELVAATPEPRSMAQLRRRVRRRRWHAAAVVAVVAVVSVVSVGAAASLRHTTVQPSISVAPTRSTAQDESQWCGVSRDVLVRIAKLTAELAPGDRLEAKLMTWGELHRIWKPSATIANPGGLHDDTVIWAVEALGTVTPEFTNRSYAWGVFTVDAHTNRVYGLAAGSGTSPRAWAELPDHSTACPPSTASIPPTTVFRDPECTPGKPPTMTFYDHGTGLNVTLSRAYWCERLAALQPDPSSHLDGHVIVKNGEVTATYYKTTDVITTDGNGHLTDTAVDDKTPVPTDRLPPAIQAALRNPGEPR